MPKYSFWKSFVYCFFSRDLYQDVGERWKGTGYGYLFLVLLIISVIRAGDLQWETSTYLPGFVKKLPDVKLEKGVFSTTLQQPWSFTYQNSGIYVDTTGKIDSKDQIPGVKDLAAFLLINKKSMTLRRQGLNEEGDKTSDYAKFPPFAVNQVKMQRWAALVIPWVGIGFFAFAMIFWVLFEILALLIYGLIGLLFSEIRGKKLGFSKALRLAIVAHVPGLILSTFLFLANTHWPFANMDFEGMGFCFFALSCGYLYFAVNSQTSPQPPPLPVGA